MKLLFFLVCLAVVVVCSASPIAKKGWNPKPVPAPLCPPIKGTLRLVHVLFRHGDRNVEKGTVWADNPYADEKYYPEGFGQLTNQGKMREYRLGQFFRRRYGCFLGDIWNIDLVDFRSTDSNRTKMSGELVMAGLWPPRGSNIWNKDLAWQPIPYNYAPADEELSWFKSEAFSKALDKALADPEIKAYLEDRHGETLQILKKNTGSASMSYFSALLYFDVMKVQNNLGFKMQGWTSQLYPEPLNSFAVDFLKVIATANTDLSKMGAGSLLNKILNDSISKKNGTISPSRVKLFAYSAHDFNVASMHLVLRAKPMVETPPYGSSVMFEVHEIRGVWGIKLFFHDYKPGSPHPLAIPGCTHFCPIDQFRSLVAEILP